MSVIKNKEKIDVDNLSVAEKVKSKLFEKQAVFFESVYSKYSIKERARYINDHDINEKNLFSVLSIYIGFFILVFGCSVSFGLGNFLYGFLCLFIGFPTLLSSTFPFFQRMTAKIWLSKEKNNEILRNEMFWNSSVDKETMRYVVQCYGKEHFVNLMKGKEYLQYKDIFFYVKQLDNESAETAKLSKIAECLIKD